MKTSFKILLATDYSEAVMNAERYAFQFAKNTGSFIKIIHVFAPPLSIPYQQFDPYTVDYTPFEYEMEKLEDHALKILRLLKIDPEEIHYSCEVREGNVTLQVVEEAKESDIDFIITGTHGVRGFIDILLGNTAWGIIKKADCPVLALPEDALFTSVKNIVFATNYRLGEIPVINYLVEIAKIFDAELTLVHISNFSVSKEFEVKLYEDFRSEVNTHISYEKLNIKLIHSDKIIEGLNDFCTRTNANWLVMSPEKRDLFEKVFEPSSSKTRKMSFHSKIPLLAIPDFYKLSNSSFWKKYEIQKVHA